MFLSITKARVQGIDKDVTKTGNDRRVELCPRAITVLERQLRLRERLVKTGRIDHECLFFTQTSAPIRDLVYPYSRWRRTLQRLAIRYRKPYAARHSSVSWDLMLGRNPLWVAKQHGHSIATMLWVRRLDRRDFGDGPPHAAGGDERGPTKFAGRTGLATDRLTRR